MLNKNRFLGTFRVHNTRTISAKCRATDIMRSLPFEIQAFKRNG
jgi:hypothetical protein